MTIHLPKVNQFGGGNGGGGGSSSFPITVTSSGSSLPVDLSGYSAGDTFLNTSDKKVYKTEETITGYTLATGVTNTATFAETTGIVTDFYSYQGSMRSTSKTSSLYWSGNLSFNIHFKINETLTSNTYYAIFQISSFSGGTGKDCVLMIKDKKLHWIMGGYDYGPTTWAYNDILFDYELDFDTEYFLKLKKEGNVLSAELLVDGYNGTIVASNNSIATENWYVTSSSTIRIGGLSGGGGSSITYTYINQLLVYLGDTSGDFVTANTGLSWDNGTSLTDKTEYADKTNGILYLYENDELVKIGSSAPTVLTDQTSTSMALAGNTIYKWTNALTSLSFASAEVSDLETVLYFTTGGTISFTDSSNLKWGGDGSAPSLEINTIYCISIRNGLAEIDTFGTVS